MPKKFVGENTKAAAARARKSEKLEAEKHKLEKEKEDAYWQDDDKALAKKQTRRAEAEMKRQEALEKKKERDQLIASEEATEKKAETEKKGGSASKVTRAQIKSEHERREAAAKGQATKEKTCQEKPIEENLNRSNADALTATNLDEAISVLSLKEDKKTDRHPERRMKAAFEEFEQVRLPQLKAENPTLRLSQLKQMLREEWQKHPNNPMLQR